MTFMDICRFLALGESRALRGYARWGVPVPKHVPLDYWGEWDRLKHTNGSTFKGAA